MQKASDISLFISFCSLLPQNHLYSLVGHIVDFSFICILLYANYFYTVVQLLSGVLLFVTLCTAACQASLSFTFLVEFAQIHVHCISDAI